MIYRIRGVFVFMFGCYMIMVFASCKSGKTAPPVFTVLDAATTGLDFTNTLTPTGTFNMFHYMYFYNGAGIGAADFNNDGRTDLFFSSNQGNNTLYLNQGGLKFRDVSGEAKIPRDGGWSTGVSVVDINNDGLMDIYVCRVGNFEVLKSRNQLLVCQGIDGHGVPYYTDKAAQYGLDFSGFSTQAAFVDYDMDGDLDMFLLNHAVHQNGSYAERMKFAGTYDPLSGDRIFKNEGAAFKDATKETGINSSAISYGLGIAVSDINLDGYPDLYIGNDFHENDYLYINQRNGTFSEEINRHIMHTSQFSMGVDVADINNDGFPEIISMDMLPSDPYILKRSLGEDEFNTFNLKVSYGYNYQYTRNNLQINRRNGMFSEAGLMAGVFATDWSWAPLWMDFDNDGLKDLFISNGIPKRMNDMDYINYISGEEIQEKIRTGNIGGKDMALSDKFPQIKIPNKFFSNAGDNTFRELADAVENDRPTYSNGAVYADLDNDGDLDVVVNNIDDPALVYENRSNDKKDRPFLQLRLAGPSANRNAVGARVVVFANGGIRTYEKFGARGFQSSMEIPLLIGMSGAKVDSMFLVWPDNTCQLLAWSGRSTTLAVQYTSGLPVFDYSMITRFLPNPTEPVTDITASTAINYLHRENPFNEFDREALMPHMVSREGPALATGDANADGLEDVFIGSAKTFRSALYLQSPGGRFYRSEQPALDLDSMYEDVDACWADVNNDSHPDLLIASGGNEYYGEEEERMPRVYLNDGKGKLARKADAFNGIFLTASCIAPCDINGDGHTDVFIGGRAVPWEYGEVPRSYLLQNDGTGKFRDVTGKYCADLLRPGFVTSSAWCDIDKDGDKDLVVSLEWGGICSFLNKGGSFTKKVLTGLSGWWNVVLPYDMDGDGDMDILAGNLGLNSRLTASEKEPARMYYNDFDDNGKKEQVLTYYLGSREIPFANKDELQRQMPFIRKKFLYAKDFARAGLDDIFPSAKLEAAGVLTADYFASAILVNDGKGGFSVRPLPAAAQLSPLRDAAITDANGDGLPDVITGGNFYGNNIQMGRYDADFGTLLINTGKGGFQGESLNGIAVTGQVRRIRKIRVAGRDAFVLARNNDSTMVIRFDKKR